MKSRRHLALLLTWLLASAAAPHAAPQGTAFTYQGRMSYGSSPANGYYDFQFKLFDALANGSQQGSTVSASAVAVTNGLFTAVLDFGDVFAAEARWLEIAVRTNGLSSYVSLAPRQALTPTPYALSALNARGVAATNLSGALSLSQMPSGIALLGAGSGLGLTNTPLRLQDSSNFWATVTPEMFGATGDGVTDDSAALQAACNFTASKWMRILCLSTNGYALAHPVYPQWGNTIEGPYIIQEINSCAMTPTFAAYGSDAFICTNGQFALRNAKLQGAGGLALTPGKNGVVIKSVNPSGVFGWFSLDNVNIQRFGGAGLLITNADEVQVSRCTIADCGTDVNAGGYLVALTFDNCVVGGGFPEPFGTYNSSAFVFSGGSGIVIRGCDFGNTSNSVVKLLGGGASVKLEHSNVEQNGASYTGPMFYVGPGCRLTLENNRIVGAAAATCIVTNDSSGVLLLINQPLATQSGVPPVISGNGSIQDVFVFGYPCQVTNAALGTQYRVPATVTNYWPVAIGNFRNTDGTTPSLAVVRASPNPVLGLSIPVGAWSGSSTLVAPVPFASVSNPILVETSWDLPANTTNLIGIELIAEAGGAAVAQLALTNSTGASVYYRTNLSIFFSQTGDNNQPWGLGIRRAGSETSAVYLMGARVQVP